VGPLPGDPVDEVFVILLPPVILVTEADAGDNRDLCRRSCQTENKIKARCKDIAPEHEKDRQFDPVEAHEGGHVVEDRACIVLVPVSRISPEDHGVFSNIPRKPRDTGDTSQHGPLEARRGPAIPKNKDIHLHSILEMAGYKHIEKSIGRYIADRYHNVVEIGVGRNFTAAMLISRSGIATRCIDLKEQEPPAGVFFFTDDIFSPDIPLYAGCDLIYAIRPAEEMMPPLTALARRLSCDLIVYHLGFEGYRDRGEVVDCGVPIHVYRHMTNEQGSKQG